MSDFTFNEFLTGILKFNDENVMHIGFNSDTEDIIITNWNADANTHKTLQTNLNGGGGGGITIDDVAEKNFSGDIELTTATTIKFGAFAESGITSVTGTAPTKVETEAFRYCDSLVTVNLPNVQNVNTANYAFANCANLEEVYLPKLSNISSTTYMCATCPKLKVADLGVIGSMINNMFNGDTDLRTIILRKTGSICTTSWANAAVFGGIYNNPDESTIYVPEDLITTYQNATNWSALYSMGVTFAKIEGSIYE